MSALQAGLVFTILAAAYLAASMRAPALTERHGRRVLAVGALTLAAGHAALLASVAIVGVGGSVAVARSRADAGRRRDGPRDHAAGDDHHGRR